MRTFGGRTDPPATAPWRTCPPAARRALDAARGRFARNAVIQGAAAELFKAWAATVRATTRDLGAQIVLCLHDELILVHVPASQRAEVARDRLGRRARRGFPALDGLDAVAVRRGHQRDRAMVRRQGVTTVAT